MRTEKCRGPRCGRPITWAVDEHGKKIPLDAIAPTYQVTGAASDGTPTVKRAANALVSHFATCKDAHLFTGQSK